MFLHVGILLPVKHMGLHVGMKCDGFRIHYMFSTYILDILFNKLFFKIE